VPVAIGHGRHAFTPLKASILAQVTHGPGGCCRIAALIAITKSPGPTGQ